ncbi:MAG: phenylacetate-CoA oxygenase subunit PaaI, partial [Roseovarius sp.]|nr:phenylacetate-CoA oxygenase subunit PaaI [Roseovarius sp.]
YYTHHPWTARSAPATGAAPGRNEHDMRLSVFDYPLTGWTDAVVMNLLMGRAVVVQLGELAQVSYQPLAEAFREIAPVETRHAELALEGVERLMQTEGVSAVEAAVSRWWPRVAATFGREASDRFDRLRAMGLRHTPNIELRTTWERESTEILAALGLRRG